MTGGSEGSGYLSVVPSAEAGGTIAVSGELDAHSAPALESELGCHDGDLRIDLSGVTFIDSTGLRVLLGAEKHVRANEHRLVLVEPSVAVLRLLRLTSLHQRFEIEL